MRLEKIESMLFLKSKHKTRFQRGNNQLHQLGCVREGTQTEFHNLTGAISLEL